MDDDKLVPEALDYNLHVFEDEAMIKWLGRETFADTCVNGSLGWQDQVFGGEDGRTRIFRCTMTHNRKPCVALYLEDEYEHLVLEAYWTAMAKVKMANNMYNSLILLYSL